MFLNFVNYLLFIIDHSVWVLDLLPSPGEFVKRCLFESGLTRRTKTSAV